MMQVTKNYVTKEYNFRGEKDFTSYVLGIDVGGTNTNLGVAGIKNKRPTLLFSLNFKSQELPSLVPAIKDALIYAKEKYNAEIKNACIGAAGVVSPNKDYAELTHVKWSVNTKELLNETTLNSAL
jgi:glucokinase